MKDYIDKLLDKYWEGETSLAEEAELKTLLSESDGYEEEKLFFEGLAEVSQMNTEKLKLPHQKDRWINHWGKIAAVLIFFLVAGTALYQYQEQKAEREAYLAVMDAFFLINENMQKGTNQLEVLEDFRHLNTSHEIFNLKEKTESK